MLTSRKTAVRQKANKREVSNKENEATIYLYGDIGGWFGIDHKEWIAEFNGLSAGVIHVRIDSGGGDIFAGRAIKTAIMQSKAKTVVHVDGLAASAASFVAMSGDEIEISDGAFLMVHNAMSAIDFFGYYNAEEIDELIADLGKERELHDKLNDAIADDYVKRTGVDKETAVGWMNNETWFTAKEALENKFVDRIYDGEPIENTYDFSLYANVPDVLAPKAAKTSKRAIERALRDAGLTNREAKKIISEGIKDDVRDDEIDEPEEHRDDVDDTEASQHRIVKRHTRPHYLPD